MIKIDVDLYYLCNYFGISAQKIKQYGNMPLEQIMKQEAASGNAAAAKFDSSILQDPTKLVKLFKLMTPRNRYKIIKNMNESDLKYLMQFLSKEQLTLGLGFFTKDKLLAMTQELPKEKIAKVVFNRFSPEHFMKLIPESEMNKFFESSKVQQQKANTVKAVQTLPTEALQGLMENLTGQKSKNIDRRQVGETLNGLSPEKFTKAIQSLDKESKGKVIIKLAEEKPDLILEFSKAALVSPLKILEKQDLVKSLGVLENEDLVNMLGELPKDLMTIVDTQIDGATFADVLCNKFQKVLSELAVA